MLKFSRSVYLCNQLSESIYSWIKITLPHPTPPHLYPIPLIYPTLPYSTLPTPPLLSYPTLPYPTLTLTLPYPRPSLPYPTPTHPTPTRNYPTLLLTLEASVAYWLSFLPCKPGVVCSNPGFSSLSDETLNRGPVSI